MNAQELARVNATLERANSSLDDLESRLNVLIERVKVKDWVIEQHKLALWRLGDAIESGDLAAIQGRWSVVKKFTEPHSHG